MAQSSAPSLLPSLSPTGTDQTPQPHVQHQQHQQQHAHASVQQHHMQYQHQQQQHPHAQQVHAYSTHPQHSQHPQHLQHHPQHPQHAQHPQHGHMMHAPPGSFQAQGQGQQVYSHPQQQAMYHQQPHYAHAHVQHPHHAPGQMGPPNGMPPQYIPAMQGQAQAQTQTQSQTPQDGVQGGSTPSGAGGAGGAGGNSAITPDRRSSQGSPAQLHAAAVAVAGPGQPQPQPQGQAPPQEGPIPSSTGVGQGPVLQTPIKGQKGNSNVFGAVMQPPATGAKVYASVYSGIPVFEAMIRGISVMRRTSDSWVNATQILKVAGIPKSTRTKILEKEVLVGLHEKVQGGYGKYQGTWIPFARGQELAAQHGVTAYLSPIFDFVPSPANVAALPVAKSDHAGVATPDRAQKTPSGVPGLSYNPMFSGRTPTPSHAGRIYSPMPPQHDLQPPPHFMNTDSMMLPPHPMYGGMYYPAPSHMTGDELAPAAELNGYGLPPSRSDIYYDAYGQPHSTHSHAHLYANGSEMDMSGMSGMGGMSASAVEPPAKRLKADLGEYVEPQIEEEAVEEEVEDVDSDTDEPVSRGQPVPTAMRLSNKPLRPKPGTAGKARSKMMALFSDDVVDVREFLGLPPRPAKGENENGAGDEGEEEDVEPEIDVDVIIDDQGHTALHWASALAKVDLVAQLIDLGADIHRGNYAGETPLVRSVLTTNHLESNTFPALLEHLSASVRTLDHAHRSVVHHIALVAGVKGRAAAARTYMTAVLGWVARGQQEQQQQQQALAHGAQGSQGTASQPSQGYPSTFKSGTASTSDNGSSLNQGNLGGTLSLKTLVDVQDAYGDTALNVAARVGNRGLVTVLLEAGADKSKGNKLGLKPVDFGVEVEALKVSAGEAVVAAIKSEAPRPERQSRDVQKNIAAIFETINDTFSQEMVAKQSKLNTTEQSVRHATRALAEKRQAVARAQAAVGELEQVSQRAENLRRALATVGDVDWTGRASAGDTSAPPAFRPLDNSPRKASAADPTVSFDLPERGSTDALIKLRRAAAWEDRMAVVLRERIGALKGEGADMAVKYRKLVSLCTKVPVDKVDNMLDGLVAAVESDGNGVDLSKVGTLMGRIKAGQV